MNHRLIAVGVVSMLIAGCAPVSVTFTLGARDGELKETIFDADRGAGAGGAKVAVIDIRGTIMDAAKPGLFASGANPVDELVARLRKAQDDSEVKAVILRINSPGGSVTASDTMYREVRRFATECKKPVVASLGEVAASGGYYLALSADEIVTQPTTITGSIGVIIPTVNVSDGLHRIGIVARSIKSGVNKDLANPLEPMREGQYAVLQGMVDEFYARFRGLVVERRTHMDSKRIDELTDGRVVSGAEAVKAGLADREGDLRDAFDRAKALAGITAAKMVKYHAEGATPMSVYGSAMAPSTSGNAAGGSSPSQINLLQVDLGEGGIGGVLGGGNAYYLWTSGMP